MSDQYPPAQPARDLRDLRTRLTSISHDTHSFLEQMRETHPTTTPPAIPQHYTPFPASPPPNNNDASHPAVYQPAAALPAAPINFVTIAEYEHERQQRVQAERMIDRLHMVIGQQKGLIENQNAWIEQQTGVLEGLVQGWKSGVQGMEGEIEVVRRLEAAVMGARMRQREENGASG